MENDDRTYKTADAQCNCLLPSQTPSNDTSQLSPLPSLSGLPFSTVPCDLGHPSGQLGSAVLALSPPSSTCIPSLLMGRAAPAAQTALAQCELCSAAAETWMHYQHYSF